MVVRANLPPRLLATLVVLLAAWPLLPTATATPIRRGRTSFDAPSPLIAVDPFLESGGAGGPHVHTLPENAPIPPTLVRHEWIFDSVYESVRQAPGSIPFLWPVKPVRRIGDSRIRGSAPFGLVEDMPDSYAAVMFGFGSLLLTASAVIAYRGRRTAAYSLTGECNPVGGRPPLAQLVLSGAPETRARS